MEVRHWNADLKGISLHVAEQGPADGPALLLLHGFPELWLSWRHQMAALAPDVRGYGDSDAPADAAAYSVFHSVGDLVGLLNHLGLPKVFVVGHDWGALVAWHLSLFRPDMVRAMVTIGVPYFPRQPTPPTEYFAALGDGFYIAQFQLCIGNTNMFILGDKDVGLRSFGTENYVKSGGLKANVPNLDEVAIIQGHHFLQQEQPERVNAEIFSFLDKFAQ